MYDAKETIWETGLGVDKGWGGGTEEVLIKAELAAGHMTWYSADNWQLAVYSWMRNKPHPLTNPLPLPRTWIFTPPLALGSAHLFTSSTSPWRFRCKGKCNEIMGFLLCCWLWRHYSWCLCSKNPHGEILVTFGQSWPRVLIRPN